MPDGWGNDAWGDDPWGSLDSSMLTSYFLPPVVRRYPRPGTIEATGRLIDRLRWHLEGQDGGEVGAPAGYYRVAGTDYRTATWTPLTDAQVDALTLAGFGGRIRTVANLGQLPPSID